MPEQSGLEDAYLSSQFIAIQKRVALRERSRQRRRTTAWVGGGLVASLALTGGAIAVVQATQTEKSVSVCFQTASVESPSTEVGASRPDGSVAPEDSIEARVRLAEVQCAAVWQIGLLNPGGSSDGTSLPAPILFTCLLADGRLGVFPVTDGADCESLDLRSP